MKTGEKDYTDFFLAFLAATVLTTTREFSLWAIVQCGRPIANIYIYIYI